MSAVLGVMALVLMPSAALLLLLKVVDAVQRRRAETVARQIAVTDAIHRELGAIVAPVVRRRRGGWRVELPMDPRCPETARVVELASLTLERAVEVAVVPPAAARPGGGRRGAGRMAAASA